MRFASPDLLLVLLLLPVVVGMYVLLERRRAQRAAAWSTPGLLANMVAGGPGRRRHIPAVLFLLASTLLLVGFARPQAKFSETKEGATVVLMVDVSGSMAAQDVGPSRLGAADQILASFVKTLPSKYRVALLTFSDHIAVRVAPTYDRTALVKGLPVKTELQGTGIGDAVDAAVKVAEKAVGPSKPGSPHPPATVLLISDGGQNAGKITPTAAAAAARKAHIPISTVAIGTPGGVVHQQVPLGKGKQTFPLVQQVPVDPTSLKLLAKGSGGAFYPAASPTQLKQVYKDLGSRLVHDRKLREITVDVTGAAIVVMLIGALLSGVWFRRIV